MAEAVGGEQGVARHEQAGDVGHQIPVVHEAAGHTEQLALLRQEFGAGPAHAVTLQDVLGGIEARFGEVLVHGHVGLALLTHHHAPDDLPLQLRHIGQVGVEGQLIAHLLQLVIGQCLRPIVGVLGLLDVAALQEVVLPLGGLEPLLYVGKNVAVTVGVGDLLALSVDKGGGIPGVVVIARGIGREGASGGGELGPDGFFHHVELRAGAPAHGVAVADGAHGAELAQAGIGGGEQPHTGGTAHGDDGCLAGEHIELAGAGVNAGGAYTLGPVLAALSQQGGDHDAIHDLHAQTAAFLLHSGLEGSAPDADGEPILIIIGEHQLGLFIPEGRTLELVLGVPDLAAHLLDVLQMIPALAALYIMRDAVVVAVVVVQHGLHQILRRNTGAGVGGGALPVVAAAAARAGTLGRALFHQNHALAALGGVDGGHAAGDAAAQHDHIRLHAVDLAHLGRIGPFHFAHAFAPPFIHSFIRDKTAAAGSTAFREAASDNDDFAIRAYVIKCL